MPARQSRVFMMIVVSLGLLSGVLSGSADASQPALNGWHVNLIDKPHKNLSAVSCGSASFCAAVDAWGYAFLWNGHGWSRSGRVDRKADSSMAISCPSASFCAAVDQSGYALTYQGSQWTDPVPVNLASGLDSISCVSDTFCMASSSYGYVATYDGSSWSAPVNIDSDLVAVACGSPQFCVALDDEGYVETYDGASWSDSVFIDPAGYDLDVSCPSAQFCVAIDIWGYAITYDGSGWSDPVLIQHIYQSPTAISCASSTLCAVTFGSRERVSDVITYDGSTWSQAIKVEGKGRLTGVSCTGSAFCAAVGSARALHNAAV